MVEITNSAAEKVLRHLSKRGKGLGIRIGVKTTGCSGLAYVLEFVDIPLKEDLEIKQTGFSIFVNPKSSPYLQGMIIDYVKNGLNEGFEFRNPNEKDRCGCGESFRV